MKNRNSKIRSGLTLVELMVVLLIVAMLMVAVGVTLVDAQNAWGTMYKRSYSGPVVDAVILTKEFDRAVRKSSKLDWAIDGVANATSGAATGNTSLQVYYFKNPTNLAVTSYDGYSKFYYVSGSKQLKVDEGDLTAGTLTPANVTATRVLANNVSACTFMVRNAATGMTVYLDSGTNTDVKDGNVKMTVACSAFRHNP